MSDYRKPDEPYSIGQEFGGLFRPRLLLEQPIAIGPRLASQISQAENEFVRIDEHMATSCYAAATREALLTIEALSAAAIDGAEVDVTGLIAADVQWGDKGEDDRSTRARWYKTLIKRHNSQDWARGICFDRDFLFGLHEELAYPEPAVFRRSFRGEGSPDPEAVHPRLSQTKILPPASIPRYVDDLLGFCSEENYPTQVQAPLVHFQLFYIRPFRSHNEALARHLSYAVYARRGFCRHIFMPAATAAIRRIDHPIDEKKALGALETRPMDLWLYHGAKVLLLQTRFIQDIEARFEAIEQDWERRMPKLRGNDVCRRLVHDLLTTPIVTSSYLQKEYGRTAPVANEALGKLQDKGILKPLNDNKRYRMFFAKEVLDLYFELFDKTLPRRYVPGRQMFEL